MMVYWLSKENGELISVKDAVKLDIAESSIQVTSKDNAMLGLYCALIKNMVVGIKISFQKH